MARDGPGHSQSDPDAGRMWHEGNEPSGDSLRRQVRAEVQRHESDACYLRTQAPSSVLKYCPAGSLAKSCCAVACPAASGVAPVRAAASR